MKILYHHRTRGKNVEGVHIREIVNALMELGNEVCVVSPPGVNPMMESGEQRAKSKGQRAKPLCSILFAACCQIVNRIWDWISRYFPQIGFEIFELLYNFVGYYRLERVLEYGRRVRRPYDAIYERYAFSTWVGAYMAKKSNIPMILEVNEVSGIKRVRRHILVGLAKWIERRAFKAADSLVVVSHFLKRHIVEKMGIDADKIHVIPNAIDPGKFNPDIDGGEVRKRLGLDDKFVIGFVGSLVAWSNLGFLVQVFAEISKERQDAHLLLVGDGPVRDIVEGLVKEENVEDKVIFTGSVEHADVPKFIAAMDICVIPQSNEYRSPVKLFEYMAMAKPVVAPRLEPIERIITHEENGILFEQDSQNSLKGNMKHAIMYLMEDDEKREKLAALAWRTVLENYTWLRNAEEVLKIYDTIVAGNATKAQEVVLKY